ncbi:SRPBCC domain-containing protein [Amnibacterium sp.]|uniref:SRPBCC domain-containing protein n=1 Tax=Amnibacterium sp. TaxID=1872496 RepID=UPI00261BC112|nr:SRPBCC domain-containing protein [Amnibacterium sp.]MCU1473017.1 hypothetical protein [Amnibacterium sp.]
MPDLPPVRREVLVPAVPAIAFEVFTTRIGTWWPLAELSVHGDGSVAFVDGEIVETAADGRRAVWGTVTAWDPPDQVSFTWHPGRDAGVAGRVTVSFTERGDATLVVLEHAGWGAYADAAAARAEYDHGWPMVLDRFRVATSAESA